MLPHPVEQGAQAKSLGAFEQSYRESCTLSRAWGYTILCGIFIVIWGVALLSTSIDQLLRVWPFLLFSVVWFSICFSVIVSSWRSYLNPEWIYLYSHGFIYKEGDHIQTYHWNEILSIELRYSFSVNGKNHVACFYSGFSGRTVLYDFRDENAFVARNAEIVSELFG